jgi:hypothetical protein
MTRKTLIERAREQAKRDLGDGLPKALYGLSVSTVAHGSYVIGYEAGYRAASRKQRK